MWEIPRDESEALKVAAEIPFVDLHSQYKELKDELDDAITKVIDRSAFISGHFVDAFEHEFREATESRFCISCANGTDALFLIFKALGLKSGDQVLCPANSWISSAETISLAGGQVVFVDVDPITKTLDIADCRAKINDATVGIVAVHLFGQVADMESISQLAAESGLWVVEDCAQAHLARVGVHSLGYYSSAAAYSFYPGKNLGAMGDAGAITTNNEELAEKVRLLSRHGGLKKGEHLIEGMNSRLDGLQAAILSVKLRQLRRWTEQRIHAAKRYSQLIKSRGIDCVVPDITGHDFSNVWHLFVIEIADRDLLRDHLARIGIETGIHYPVALPFLPAYKRLGAKPDDFQVAYSLQSRILSLPFWAGISEVDQQSVVDAICRFYE